MKEFTKDEVFEHWKDFLMRIKKHNVSLIMEKINDGFCDHYQEIIISRHPNKRTFIFGGGVFYFYFDYMIEQDEDPSQYGFKELWHIRFVFIKHDIRNKNKGEYYDAIEFLYKYCNPEFLAILEKISWETDG
jgi:hypothetical protein